MILMFKQQRWLDAIALMGLIAALPLSASAANNSTWTPLTAGSYNWAVTGQWSPATYPNGVDDIAHLDNDITGSQTVDLGQAIILGQLYIGDVNASHKFILTNSTANALTFQVSSGAALISQTAGSAGDTVAANMILASDTTIANNAPNSQLLVSGSIGESGGSRVVSLTSVGWGGWIISGNNSYSGGTIVSSGNGDATPLELRNGSALGSGSVTGLAHLVFNMSTNSTVPNRITITAGNGTPFKNIGNGRVNLSGSVAGANNAWSVLAGTGSDGGIMLSGSNSFGRPLIDNTTVWANHNKAFNSAIAFGDQNHGGKLYLMDGITLSQGVKDFWFASSNTGLVFTLGTDQTNINCSFAGGINLRIAANPANSNTWVFESGVGSTVTVLSVISQSYDTNFTGVTVYNPVVKIGAGTVAFSSANTYGGGTTVSNGALLVNNVTGSGTGSGAVSVMSNATLGGVGTVLGQVNAVAGGIIRPGTNGMGVLTMAGVQLASNAVISVSLGGTNSGSYGQVALSTGSIELAGSRLSLSVTNGFVPLPGDYFTIIRNGPGSPVSGMFTCGGYLKVPGLPGIFNVNYAGGAGNDVVIQYKAIGGTVIVIR